VVSFGGYLSSSYNREGGILISMGRAIHTQETLRLYPSSISSLPEFFRPAGLVGR
jgi:hypothetical protein